MKSDVARDSIFTIGTGFINAIMAFIASMCITSVLTPYQKGLVNETQIFAGILIALLSFSLSSAVIYFVAKFGLNSIKNALKKLVLIITFVIVLVGLIAAFTLRYSYFKDTPFIYIILSIIYATVSFLTSINLAILRGENKFAIYNKILLMQSGLTVLVAITIIFIHNPMIIVICNIIIVTIAIIISSSILFKSLKTNNKLEAILKTRDILSFSLKSYPSNVLTFICAQASSFILIANKGGIGKLGIFTTALALLGVLYMIPDAVSMVIMPRISGMTKNEDKVKLTLISCKIVTYITTICSILLAIAASFLLPILFPAYAAAVIVFFIMIPGSILITYSKVLANSISAYGRPELNIISTFIGVLVTLSLGFILIQRLGLEGAAISSSTAFTLQGLASIIIFCKFTKTPFWNLVVLNKDEISSIRSIIRRRNDN